MNNNVKEKILASIEKAQQMGYTLVCDDWGDDNRKCACALGCLLVVNGENPNDGTSEIAADLLEVSYDWASSFIDGFDDNGTVAGASDHIAWKLGSELRKELKPVPMDQFINNMVDNGE